MNKNRLIVIIVSITILISSLLIIYGISKKNDNEYNEVYYLKTHDNSIALYYGEAIEEIYEVTVGNLPIEDRSKLEKGIKFNSKEKAIKALEDYDG